MDAFRDHAALVKELSERRQQDLPPIQQQAFPKSQDPSDSPRPIISEPPRESSPPRFSQLHDPPPEAPEPRRATSTATNPSTLVNPPSTVSNVTGPATHSGGVQSASAIQDRYYHQSTLAPDRRPSTFYDPVRGEDAIQGHPSDDGDHDRRFPVRRVSVPRPLPVFTSSQDVNGNRIGSGSRAALRGVSGPEWNMDHQGFTEPQPSVRLTSTVAKSIVSEISMSVLSFRVRKRLNKGLVQPTKPQQGSEINIRRKVPQNPPRNDSARFLIFTAARQQSLLINGAIGLQVIVGAITTGVAAGSRNVQSSPPITLKSRSIDT